MASTLQVDQITNGAGTGAPSFPFGILNSFNYFQASQGANGEHWSSSSNSFADGSLSGGTNALTTVYSNGLSITAAGSSVAGITFTPSSITATYLIVTNTTVANGTGSTQASLQLTDGTTQLASRYMQGSAASDENPCSLVGLYVPGVTSPVTVKVQIATDSGGSVLIKGGVLSTVPILFWTVIQITS